MPDNWLVAWREFQEYLEQLSQTQQQKIILAFDECEALHTKIFKKKPEEADNLLGAMRSFSQHQNKVVFLFVGATQFVDLKKPNWDRYFIHAIPFSVDYLSVEDTKKLITEPVDLNYPPDVVDKIVQQTQGHPALTQMCCYYLVYIANTEGRKDMTMADLDNVLKNQIIQRKNTVLCVSPLP